MECRERPVYRGFGCFATLLYLCMCVRDTFCGVERVRDACDVRSDEADESDDDAQAAYVVAWEKKRVMNTVVFRHA